MAILLKLFYLILGLGGGIACMVYSYQLTRLFGYNSYAEKYLGDGGTYSMWKLLGLLLIIGTIWLVFR